MFYTGQFVVISADKWWCCAVAMCTV